MGNRNEMEKGSDSVRKSGRPRKPKVHWSPDIDAGRKRTKLDGQNDEKEETTSSLKPIDVNASNIDVNAILAEEIQKQVLNRLGAETKSSFQDIQVAEIQEVCIKHKQGEAQDDEVQTQQILKVKLLATLYIPLVFQRSDEQTQPTEDCNKLETHNTLKTSEFKHSKSQQEEQDLQFEEYKNQVLMQPEELAEMQTEYFNELEAKNAQNNSEYKDIRSQQEDQVLPFEDNIENMTKIDAQEEQDSRSQQEDQDLQFEDNTENMSKIEVLEEQDNRSHEEDQVLPFEDNIENMTMIDVQEEQVLQFEENTESMPRIELQGEQVEKFKDGNEEGDVKEKLKNLLIEESDTDQEEVDVKEVELLDVGDTLLDVGEFDMYNFDFDRTEDKIVEGQVWALYDEKDGMPRLYAFIYKVLTTSPFNAEITWLEPNAETLGSLIKQRSGCRLTCGDFFIEQGQKTLVTYIDCFSHVVKAKIQPTGDISVIPDEGDVWALYNTKMISGGSVSQSGYEIVQVVGKDSDSLVTVVPLVKVDGFRTRFTHNGKPYGISTKQVELFSHRIPSILLDRVHASTCPDPCLELDPASTPEI